MNEEQIVEGLRRRAAEDARDFREKFGRAAEPNEKWLDNSFTAAVPLVTEATELPPGSAEPQLFQIYKDEVMRALGKELPPRPDNELDRRNKPDSLVAEPTPGED